MQTCARHASSSDKIQLRSVTRIVPVPRNVSRDTTGWMEARLQSNHRHLEPRESRLELTDELFPIDRSWWNGLDARVWYQLSDVTIRGVALPVKSIKSKPWPAEMRSAIIHAFRPIPPVGRAQRTITCSKILGRFGGLLTRRGKRRARDIDSSVCSAGKRSLRVVEFFSLEGNGEKKKEREERRLVERRG